MEERRISRFDSVVLWTTYFIFTSITLLCFAIFLPFLLTAVCLIIIGAVFLTAVGITALNQAAVSFNGVPGALIPCGLVFGFLHPVAGIFLGVALLAWVIASAFISPLMSPLALYQRALSIV